MDEILAKTAVAQLTPVDPTLAIIIVIHPMNITPSGPHTTINGNEILLQKDIDASFGSPYVTPYTKPPYSVPGVLKYSSIASISDLSTLTTKKDDPIALKKTKGTITCSVQSRATDPSTGNTDAAPSYDLKFEFISSGQTMAKSE